MGGNELKVLDHRMRLVVAELADDAEHHGPGLPALECDLAFAEIRLDAIELAEEVVVPERAAEFAVGDRLEADLFLFPDGLFDLAILDRLEFSRIDLAALALGARLLQRGRPQQAADMIGAEWRRGSLHEVLLLRCSEVGGLASPLPRAAE